MNKLKMYTLVIFFAIVCSLVSCSKPNVTKAKTEEGSVNMTKETQSNNSENFFDRLSLSTYDGSAVDIDSIKKSEATVINIWGTY